MIHLRIEDGRVVINDVPMNEPYAAFEPVAPGQFRDNFPARVYTDPDVDPEWWKQMQTLTRERRTWWCRLTNTLCLGTTEIIALIRVSGDLCRARPLLRGRL